MTPPIGIAGRRARDLARRRAEAVRPGRTPASIFTPVREGPLPWVQRAAPDRPTVGDGGGAPPLTPATMPAAAEAINGQTVPPSAEEVAQRVYDLFCQDLRRDRERRGRWW